MLGEADGRYLFRTVTTAGTLNPIWNLYAQTGGSSRCSGADGYLDNCGVAAVGAFVLVVDNWDSDTVGSYGLVADRLNDRTGCASLATVAYGSAPTSAAISSAGEVDCHTIPDVSAGDVVEMSEVTTLSNNGNRYWALVDGGGGFVCGNYYSSNANCQLSGAGPWAVLTFDYHEGTFSYDLSVKKRTSPQGCTPLSTPDDFSFASPRKSGSIATRLELDCFTFSRAANEPDARFFARAVQSSGSFSPAWSIVGPSGSDVCSGSYGYFSTCRLTGSGQFAFVVRDSSMTQTGGYFAAISRASTPSGCTTFPSVEFGSAASAGEISQAAEADCFSIPNVEAGQTVDVAFTGTGGSGNPRWAIVDGNGVDVCTNYYTTDTCELTGAPGWTLIIHDYADQTFSYNAAVRRLTNPAGCTVLDSSVWSFASSRTDGSIDSKLDSDCFTFTRSAGQPDSNYWLRTLRTSGEFTPRWTVFGPTGDEECRGAAGYYTGCKLLASGTYTVLVRDSSETGTGSYYLTTKRSTQPTGCTALTSTAFGTASTSQSLTSGGEIDCYSIPGASVDDIIELAFRSTSGSNPQPQWSVIDGDGNEQCASRYSSSTPCQLNGTGGWSVVVYDYGAGTFPYSLAVRKLNSPQGCTALTVPSAWSYTSPRILGNLDAALDADCFTFTREAGESDGSYWFKSLRTSGSNTPRWTVYGPEGLTECSGTNGSVARCQLVDAGKYAFVVRDSAATGTGSFAATARRLNEPQGCSTIASVAFGLPTTNGNISAAGESDCYAFSGSSGDQLKFTKTGVIDGLTVVSPSGAVVCGLNNSTCTLDESGVYSVVAYLQSSTTTGTYSFSAACQNIPCGQSATAITDLTPNRVGASQHVTTTIRGHDLNLLSSVQLTKGATSVPGDLQRPSADGRAVDVRFDLSGAQTGAWELTGTFLDGTTRVLSSALTVETLKPATAKVELVGRDVFRVNQPTEVTVSVTNSGNVDALGVPVTIRGIPLGSEVESVTQVFDPNGSASNPEFDPATISLEDDAYEDNESLVLPMLASRVPAGKSIRLELKITVTQTSNYVLSAASAACLVNPGEMTATTLQAKTFAGNDVDCMKGFVQAGYDNWAIQTGLSALPGAACIDAGVGIATDVTAAAAGGQDWFTVGGILGHAISLADCATDIWPPSKVVKLGIKAASVVSKGVGYVNTANSCMNASSEAEMRQRAVTSIDPNEIIGPTGSGDQRYIAADTPLNYKILFENLASATAPAQTVTISNQLSTATFQPSSVLFNEVRFSDTTYALQYPSHEIDETVDLRPAKNLLVRITASVTAGGLLSAKLQALDPETLAAPANPLLGLLPPNVVSPEGEGFIGYSVSAKSLSAGAQIKNQASIVFDDNAAIETPIWTNVVDKAAPQPSVVVTPGASTGAASVTWAGTDDASGIDKFDIYVAKGAEAFELWYTSDSANSASYAADAAGSYRFRVVARDGAGNIGQSSQATIGLDPTTTSVPTSPGGGSGGTPQAPSPPTLAVSKPALKAKGSKVGGKITVGFPVPAGVAPAQACTGKISLTVLVGKKSVGKATGTLKAQGSRCVAALSFTVKKSAAAGKKLILRTSFAGNAFVGSAQRSTTVTVRR